MVDAQASDGLKASRKPVPVTAPEPLPVEIVASSVPEPMQTVTTVTPESTVTTTPPLAPTVTKGEGITLSPTTTEAEDKITTSQRHTSYLWESSQSLISLFITGAVIYCQVRGIQSETLNNAFFFVVATYLQRTNHTRVGGIPQRGQKEGQYMGRLL